MAFASSIAGSILEKLGSYAYQQIVFAWGFKDELNKLKETLEDIQTVLSDAEDKQEKSKGVQNWLEKLKDVLHNVKDILDEFEIQDQLRQMVNRGTTGNSDQSNKVRNLFLSTSSIALRFKLSQRIRNIWKRLKEIQESQKNFRFDHEKPEKGRPENKKRDTHALVDVPTVIGRDEDKEKISQLLMGSEDCAVISIVGLGGLGKTALAKLVYNDERVVKQFPLKLWVCVSENFEVETLAKEILISAKVVPSDDWNLQRLQTELQDILQGRKFLLVLDDVWNEDPGKWENLRELLPRGAGSKIIVTTRSKSVASIMSRQNGYELSHLSHDICLALFLRYAGINAEDNQHQNLVEIGKVIVKKCGGSPLAAKTLGSMLYRKTEEEWLHVRDSEIWELKTPGEDDIMPALRLSYNHMPTYLKPCFAYCAVFPKAFKFNSVDLVQLWSANGLIIPSDGNQVEQTGMQHLKELFDRCFFEDIEDYDFIHSFKMHDLVHDLARLVATEFLMLGSKTLGNLKKVRHLSLFDGGLFDQTIQKLPQLEKNLRTILCPITLPEPFDESNIGRFILSCKYLWVLDLSSSSFEELPGSIGHLKHLRYFSLSGNRRIRKLPASICKLVKLQALGLGGCKKLGKLPKGVSNMINLRLLELTTKEEHLLKQEIGCLGSLQVLFISRCHFLKSLFEDMSNLTSLRTLSIVDCHQLPRLPCSVNHLTALENLLISNCGALDLISKEENDSSETLSNLRSITMTKLRKVETLPQWLQKSSSTLRCLIIEDCPGFTNLPEWLQSFKSLQKLHITGCPQFPAIPEAMKLKIAHVPDVEVDSMKD